MGGRREAFGLGLLVGGAYATLLAVLGATTWRVYLGGLLMGATATFTGWPR